MLRMQHTLHNSNSLWDIVSLQRFCRQEEAVNVAILMDVTTRLGDGVIGWAIGAVMAALVALGVQTARKYYYSRPSAAIWGVGESDAEYQIVLPARFIPTDETRGVGWPWVPMGDAYAASLIVETLRTLKRSVRVTIYAAGELPSEKKAKSNLVAIGGTNFNSLTRELIQALGVPISYTQDARSPGHPVMETTSGDRFISDVETDAHNWQIVKSDWGAVVAAPSPYPEALRSNRRVFLVMGNGSQGTVAAAKVLSLPEHQPLGPAVLRYIPILGLIGHRHRNQLYSRDILACLRESSKCVFLFCSQVERGYVSYPNQSAQIPWS
jgi:hypothetical protein